MQEENPWSKLIHHDDYELSMYGLDILVKNNVFTPDPTITYSTSQILNHIGDVKNKDILDMGCGTGVIGLYCLLHAARSCAFVDSNELALGNTEVNLKRYGFACDHLFHSDLFDDVSGMFDVIVANLPILDEVWDAHKSNRNISYRFLKKCKHYVKSGGKVFFSWASFADFEPIKNMLDEFGYKYEIITEHTLGFDWYLVKISF